MYDEMFCSVCGKELELIIGNINRYDGNTGDPMLNARKQCPQKRWWNLHDRYRGLLHADGTYTWFPPLDYHS